MTTERRAGSGAPGREPPGPLLVTAAVVLGVLMLAAATAPSLGISYRSPEAQVAIETAAAVIAVLATYLMVGRYMLSLALRDLALVGALGALALGNIGFLTVPALVGDGSTAFEVWAPVGGRLVAALAFAVAAFAPDVRIGSPRRAAAGLLTGMTLALGVVAILAATVGADLPTGFGTGAGNTGPALDAPAGFLAVEALDTLLFAAAAAGFTARALRSRDELIAWFAAGAAIAAGARLNLVVYPAVDPSLVVTGDVLRLAFYLVLLAGVLREVRRYQRRMAVAAVLDERRRLARDLHDGLAQELAFMVMQARRVAKVTGDERAAQVAGAAEAALGESRRAIAALGRRQDEPFGEVVAQVAGRLTARAGARLRLDIDAAVELESGRRDQLLNIVREAVSNGVRHGRAAEVCVALHNGSGTQLVVTDDGAGFDPGAPNAGFGLTSMRERAQAMGGSLAVRSRPGEGTEVRVELP